MQEKDLILFEVLKQKIVEMMRQSHPGINPSIAAWKGQEITDFQEDLRIRANANISEKWFYTHMKSQRPSIPRIDMLNILSKYAGYTNWDEFVFRNGHKILVPSGDIPEQKKPASANRYFYYVPIAVVTVIAILIGLFSLLNTREYTFTIVDADTQEPIRSAQTTVFLLPDGESPVQLDADKNGHFTLKTPASRIRLVINSPYYQADTVSRIVKKFNNRETIALKADDYALMIHYFSRMKVDDWEKRRSSLDKMIDPGAVICQVFGEKKPTGAMLCTKDEFIDILTVPTGTLKSLEILESRRRNGKIVFLRFLVKEKQ